jgi:hypothetical protein
LSDVVVGEPLDGPVAADPVVADQLEVLGEQALLDALERPPVQFDAVGPHQLHAVVLRRIVAGGDNHRRDSLAFGVRLGGGRRGDTEPADVAADAGERAGGGVGEQPAGRAGVPGDGDGVGRQDGPGGRGYPAHERRRQLGAGHAADAAGPEHLHTRCLEWRGQRGTDPGRREGAPAGYAFFSGRARL